MNAPSTNGTIYGPGIFQQVANKWHVPANILLGVWGMETDFGQDVATSSAGAEGEFQFIPTTAKSYGYPLTNTPDQQQRNQQLDSAAHLLSNLFKQHGSWDAALHSYSGGGYGLAQVQAKAKTISPNMIPGTAKSNIPGASAITGPIAGAVGGAENALAGIPGAISGAFNQAVSDLKYGVVLVVVLAAATFLIVRGLGGDRIAARVAQARAGGE